MITGKDLLELGLKPGKHWGEALKKINELPDDVPHLSDVFQTVLDLEPTTIEPYDEPRPITYNIVAETIDDEGNIAAVRNAMNAVATAPTVIEGAIMPDACPTGANQIPVGGVIVARNAIHPAMHSADICCSVMTTNLGKIDPKSVLDVASTTTQFGPGMRKGHGGWSNLLHDNKSLVDRIEANYITRPYLETLI